MDVWRASGSGELPGGRGIIQLLEERLTAKADYPGGRRAGRGASTSTCCASADRDFDYVVRLKAGRVVLDLGRFSPVKRKIKVRARAGAR